MVLEIHNSYCRLSGEVPPHVMELVTQVLTYRNDIETEVSQLYFKLGQARRFGNQKLQKQILTKIKHLKDTEWVCWFKDNCFPTGHINIVRTALRSSKAVFVEKDNRIKPKNTLLLPWVNRPFPPRYYQKAMIELGLNEGRGVFESAVGTGKSLIAGYLVKELSTVSLVIVPSTGLGLQMENELVKWFGRGKVENVTTEAVRKKKKLAPIRVATIQTVASLQKTGELHHLVHDVGALLVDEIHHAGSSSYTNLLPEVDHVYYRFGFTGTFLRNDSKLLDMWGFLSNVLYRYPAHQAIAEGYLTPIEVKVHELPGARSSSYHKEYDNNYCGYRPLMNKVLELCRDDGEGRQVLVLVKNKDKAGLLFHEFLKAHGVDNAYISGDDGKDVINSTISAFNDKEVRVLVGSSVIGEGIDVRSTDDLVMCQGGKSEIVMVQAVGRAVRLFEGKKLAKVHDFDFRNTKYMGKHMAQRQNVYERNFECEIKRIPYESSEVPSY